MDSADAEIHVEEKPSREAQRKAAEEEVLAKLEELLNSMGDWEKKPLVKVGRVIIELVKLPRRELKRGVEPEKLALHIRLEDSFKGLFIENAEEFDDLSKAISAKLVGEVARKLNLINKKVIEYGL